MDTIYIDDLRVDTVIGLYDWERRIRQTVRLDLAMAYDIRAAAAADDVAKTLDYKAVAKRVIAFVERSEFELVETLAERVAALVLEEFDVREITLRLDKPHALRGARGVGVRITRRAQARIRHSMTRAYVGVGSNIAPREHIPHALRLLSERFGPLTVSPVYACPAVGFDGPAFLNLVVGFDTDCDALMVVQALRCIEEHCGRVRGQAGRSRTMDLDLLLHGELCCQQPGLKLPRADILRYAFTLKPLADIAPQARHPESGTTYADLWAAFDATGQPLTASDLQITNEVTTAAPRVPR